MLDEEIIVSLFLATEARYFSISLILQVAGIEVANKSLLIEFENEKVLFPDV